MMSKSPNSTVNPAKGRIFIQADPFVTLLEHVISHENTPGT